MGGAGAALLTGVVDLADVATVWDIVWNATFTFVALIVISLILDKAGVFAWAALRITRWGGGRGRVLFPLIVFFGAVIAALFANDGAALLLTPIVLAILTRLDFSASAALAFIFATGFVADTTSLPLVTSNLVNIVTANYFGVSFSRYALVMVPVNIVSLIATLTVLWFYFHRHIPHAYRLDRLEEPASAIVDHQVFRAAFPTLALLLACLFMTALWEIPLAFVMGGAALVLMAIAGRLLSRGKGRVMSVQAVLVEAPWQIVTFSIGMYLVVYGLGNDWLTDWTAGLLVWLAAQGDVTAALGTGLVMALLASIMNNMPSTLVGAMAIDQLQVAPLTRELMVYASIIGNDLGPKITPIGSLATLLWLHVLAKKGHRVSWGQYVRVGLAITPPVLLATLIALALWLPVIPEDAGSRNRDIISESCGNSQVMSSSHWDIGH